MPIHNSLMWIHNRQLYLPISYLQTAKMRNPNNLLHRLSIPSLSNLFPNFNTKPSPKHKTKDKMSTSDQAKPEPFIRSYRPEDEEDIMEIVSLRRPDTISPQVQLKAQFFSRLWHILSTSADFHFDSPSSQHLTNNTQCRLTAHPSGQSLPANLIVPYIFALPYLYLYPSYTFVADDGHGKCVGYIVSVPSATEYNARYISEYIPYLKTLNLDFLDPGSLATSPILQSGNAAAGVGDGKGKEKEGDTTTTLSSAASSVKESGNEIERIGRTGTAAEVAQALITRLWSPTASILHPDIPSLTQQYPAHLHIDISDAFQGLGLGRRLMDRLVVRLNEGGVEGIHLLKSGDNLGAEVFYGRVGFKRWQEVLDGGVSGEVGKNKGGGVFMVREL